MTNTEIHTGYTDSTNSESLNTQPQDEHEAKPIDKRTAKIAFK